METPRPRATPRPSRHPFDPVDKSPGAAGAPAAAQQKKKQTPTPTNSSIEISYDMEEEVKPTGMESKEEPTAVETKDKTLPRQNN